VGMRLPLGGNNALSRVSRTGEPTRIDDYSSASGPIADALRVHGLRSIVATPVVVEARTWGAMIVGTFAEEPVPPGTEDRLGQFAELMATAIANAEARAEIERLAEQEAALRRIATLIAQGAEPEHVFAAVTDETAATFHAITAVMRFEHDPPANLIVGVSKETGIPIGTRWPLAEGMTSTEVYRTGRSARLGAVDWASQPGPVTEAAREFGVTSQVACPIVVEGGLWGVVTLNAAEELPPDTEARLEKFTELVSTAIADADAKSELAASRRRIVTAADEARRRIERDLHDGIQQRLIALGFRARAMSRRPVEELPDSVAELAEGLKDAADELREVSRGIHPTILTEAGLGPALRALARRSEVPIEVDVSVDDRLPEAVEAAAYYIASEALTNVAKHAEASSARLVARRDGGMVALEVGDDGIGGADTSRGSGILGLTDRVEALDGTISVESPPGGGTTLSVRLPIAD